MVCLDRFARCALALTVLGMSGLSAAQAPPTTTPPPSFGPPSSINPVLTAPIAPPIPPTPPVTSTPGDGVPPPPISVDPAITPDRNIPQGALPRPTLSGLEPLPVLNEKDLEPGELLLAWTRAADADAGIEEVQRRYQQRPVRRVELPALGWSLAIYRLRTNREAAELRLLLLRLHPHWLADFNARYRALANARLYARTRVGAPVVARMEAGSGVRVGILDGPVAAGGALAHHSVDVRSFLGADDRAAPDNHGTAIAALIAGWDRGSSFAGVAPGAELSVGVVLRRRGSTEDTTLSAVLEGFDWLLSQRSRVVNLSLGGPPNRLLAAAVTVASRKSVVVVAAAGNDGPNAEPVYPAAYPGVIAVTATDSVDRIYPQANRGSYLLLSAPGVDVWAPDGGSGHYATGTSFAAAIVTGAVAVLLQRQPQLTPASVLQHLCRTAKDLGAQGRDSVFGCGLLQMSSAQ